MISRLCSDLPFSIWTVAVRDGDGGGSGSGGSSTGTSPAEGYAQAAASMSAAGIGSVGGRSTGPTGPSASSPAGGAQAAAGFTDGSRSNSTGPGPSASSGRSSAPSGPAASSPAGGAQAAGGFTDGSRGPGPAPSSASFGGGGGPSSLGNAPSAPSQSGTASVGQSSPAAPAPSIAAPAGLFSAAGQTPASAPSVSPATMAAEYGRAAASMRSAGIGSIGGMGLYSPSARAAQEASMQALARSAMPTTARAAEDQSMAALYDYDKEVVGVVSAGRGWTTVSLRDGTVETRSGPRGSRNNNPGNIEYGRYAKAQGAVGTDGRFAVFASVEDGKKAMQGLVTGPNYSHLSIANAISEYAPPTENNSRAYANTVAAAVGVPADTRVADLTPAQQRSMVEAMIGVEGSRVGYTATTSAVGNSAGTPPEGRHPSTSAAPSQAPSGVVTSSVNGYASTPTSNAPVPTGRPGVEVDTTDNPYAGLGVSNETFGRMLSGTPQPGLSPTGRTPPSPTAAPTQAPSVVPAQQAPTSTPRSFASTYLDPQQPTAPPAEPATPSRNSSLGRTLASTAIDVGVGAVPGLGVAASAVNLGLQLAGRPSIGQMAVDAFSSSPGWQDAPQTAARDGGDVAELPLPANMTETERAVVQERVQDFASTYLGFRDDTKRPTPREKWGDRSRYAAREYAS
ncbi:MAG: hypothetical protein KDJ36_09165 [Hyphomicrobiaceae bacterium]|nr:hypothetical protein [Hyphomicrobiaceae bacterium]